VVRSRGHAVLDCFAGGREGGDRAALQQVRRTCVTTHRRKQEVQYNSRFSSFIFYPARTSNTDSCAAELLGGAESVVGRKDWTLTTQSSVKNASRAWWPSQTRFDRRLS
jgi:hypothetical protein